jgi:hypothetical protein
MFWERDEVAEQPEPEVQEETPPVNPPPAGSVRVEFLDGAFKGRITVLNRRTADALIGRIRILDG